MGVGIAPAFVWSGGGDTRQYLLQIARDLAFADVVYSATVDGTGMRSSAELQLTRARRPP